jgi:hypothetical protein
VAFIFLHETKTYSKITTLSYNVVWTKIFYQCVYQLIVILPRRAMSVYSLAEEMCNHVEFV